jgi:predicted Zn-ribbon and HTH transcriptional regulator
MEKQEKQEQQNPLKNYFRQIKLFMKLPSGTSYYAPNAIKFTDSGEIGVYPMTGQDELLLKNPDALLNGEALVEIIKSCVPAVSDPKILLTNDIDALITAVRYATYNDSLETDLACPKCNHQNLFKLDLQYALDNMTYLDSQYVVNLDNGLTIFVKPYGFPEMLKGLHAQFEQSKITRAMESETITDEERFKLFSSAFKELSVVTYTLILNSIIKIVDESHGVDVSDKKNIQEFLQNTEKKYIDKISDLIKQINTIGIKKTFLAKCNKCGHEWENEIDFNPVNFS